MKPLPILASLIILTAILPAGSSLPPPPPSSTGPILALYEPGDATIAGLLAAGYSPCPGGSGDCFDAVTPAQFLLENLSIRDVIFVGTHTGTGGVYNALMTRANDLDAYLSAGGSLLALAEPTTGEYEFIPNTNPYPLYMMDSDPSEVANLTTYGSTHPALVGVTNASLSHWGPSWQRWILETPSYLGPIVTGEGNARAWNDTWQAPIAHAGNWGTGCVLITTLMADETAAGLHDPSRANDAADFIHAIVEWALDCKPVPKIPAPYPGFIRIAAGGPQGPIPRTTISPNLTCGPLTQSPPGVYSIECWPPQPVDGVYEYVCVGSVLHNVQYGRANHQGSVECGSSSLASCATGASGSNSAGTCWTTTGAQIGLFPLRCVARTSPQVATSWFWQTTCGSSDP